MDIADILLSIISIGFNISTTIQLIKVIRTKSARDFSTISLSWNVLAFLAEAVIFVTMNFWATAIPFFYAGLIWGIILFVQLWQKRNEKLLI